MDPLVTSSLISAGSSLLGGLGGGSKTPRYTPYVKAVLGRKGSLVEAQRALDRDSFNTKMALAKQHGINRLAMLGQQSVSMPPMIAGGEGGSNMGDAIANAGQDIGRAFHAYSTREDRAMAATSAKLSLENQSLQNDLLRSQIRATIAPGTPPGMPGSQFIGGQGTGVEILPKEVVHYDGGGTLESGRRAIGQRFSFAGSPIYGMSEDFANAGNDEGPLAWLNQMSQLIQMGGALLGAGARSGYSKLRSSLSGRPSTKYNYRTGGQL